MSLAIASLGSIGETANQQDYTCSIQRAPAANALVLVGILSSNNASTVELPSSVSGAGMVFSLITSTTSFDPLPSVSTLQKHILSIWRSMSASPVSSVISIHYPSGSATGSAILVTEVSGVSRSGTSGVNAVGTSNTSAVNQTSAVTLRTGASAASVGNWWFSLAGLAATSALTADSNYSTSDTTVYSTPASRIMSAVTTLSTGTVMGWQAGTNENIAGIIVELVLDNPAISAVTAAGVQGRRFRIPPPPAGVQDRVVFQWMDAVARQLNGEGFISLFSGTNPNTSGITGIPGSLALNIGSASTWTRLWVQGGSVASVSTTSWHPFAVM